MQFAAQRFRFIAVTATRWNSCQFRRCHADFPSCWSHIIIILWLQYRPHTSSKTQAPVWTFMTHYSSEEFSPLSWSRPKLGAQECPLLTSYPAGVQADLGNSSHILNLAHPEVIIYKSHLISANCKSVQIETSPCAELRNKDQRIAVVHDCFLWDYLFEPKTRKQTSPRWNYWNKVLE